MRMLIILLALTASLATPVEAAGPYPALHETDPALPGYLVFRPADLGPFGAHARLPVIGWVNGGCKRDNTYLSFLDEVASHGYLVITPGAAAQQSMPATPATPAAPPAAAAPAHRVTVSERLKRIAPPETTTAQLMAGVDWTLAQGARAGSPYHGKLADGVALMGHSCGGMQVLEASPDARVRTTVVLASGYWRLGGDLPGIGLTREGLQHLHAPVLYLYGGASDIVQVNAEADFVEINQVPIFKAHADTGHGLSLRAPQGGAYGKAVIDWLNWQLRGDAHAGQTFTGKDCRLCTDSAWTVEKKRIDPNTNKETP